MQLVLVICLPVRVRITHTHAQIVKLLSYGICG